PTEEVARNPELAQVLELLGSGFFAPEEPRLFQPIMDSLLRDDRYLVLADFAAYAACHERVAREFQDVERWAEMCILNIARMGKFSADRTIREYARDIWKARPVPVVMEPYRQE